MFQRLVPVAAALAALPLVISLPATAGCHGECYEKVRTPDVYQTVAKAYVVEPARTSVVHTPAVYGAVRQTVEVAPARAYHSYTAPVYGTVNREVVVGGGGYAWQRTVDAFGRERMCKVYVPPVTRTVSERVLVQPSERVTHVVPAVHKEVIRPVVVQPASTHRVHHPAVYGYNTYNVLVQRGGYHWARSW